MRKLGLLTVVLQFAVVFSTYANSQQRQQPAIDWEKGPKTVDLGGIATLNVPQGFLFTGKKGTQKLLELTQNPVGGNEVAAVVPATADNSKMWFVVF